MTHPKNAPQLKSSQGVPIPLTSVKIEARLQNLVCVAKVEHVYRNLESRNIEAVYTFPLAQDAVLLDMRIQTERKTLNGQVVKKAQAEKHSEDAIEDGDTAFMLEQAESGLYTMNVGNLAPNEAVTITITYAQVLVWHGNDLRLFLPTTIAERYGRSQLPPHQTPEIDSQISYHFTLKIIVAGPLSTGAFSSPSHRISVHTASSRTTITLAGGRAPMDRDFVLNLSVADRKKHQAFADTDLEGGYVALASFCPTFPSVPAEHPRSIVIVVDCSGSMHGDSIKQAGKTLADVADYFAAHRPQDRFNIIRFGNQVIKLFPQPLPANQQNISEAVRLANALKADMGGTRIGPAVKAAISDLGENRTSADILLITDGNVWNWEEICAEAAKSGVRCFTVGVGSAVSEAFVQNLAQLTGGACELVAPNEFMGDHILRHFKRIYAPRIKKASVRWPNRIAPISVKPFFGGDTVNAFYRFDEGKPSGEVKLEAVLESGETVIAECPIEACAQCEISDDRNTMPSDLARVAAAWEVEQMDDPEQIADTGVVYQIMTPHNNFLIIEEKAEKDKHYPIPAIRTVPHMAAAGQGGRGTVKDYTVAPASPAAGPVPEMRSLGFMSAMNAMEFMPGANSIRSRRNVRNFSPPQSKKGSQNTMLNMIDALNQKHTGDGSMALGIADIENLGQIGAPQAVTAYLIQLRDAGLDEKTLVVILLHELAGMASYRDKFSRTVKRVIRRAYKQLPDEATEAHEKVSLMLKAFALFGTI